MQIGVNAACTNIMTEATKGVGQRDRKGAIKDCFLFESWFSSKKLAEDVVDVGAYFISMVKKIQRYSTRRLFRILQVIGQEVLTLC